jgi:hypothetical protein
MCYIPSDGGRYVSRPNFDLVTQVAGLKAICLVKTGSPFLEFAVIVNFQLGSVGMKLK